MTINKTITMTVIEQCKTVIIVTLLVGILAFMLGIRYQKHASVTVENRVIVQSETTETKK